MVELITGTDIYSQQRQLEVQIIEEQNELIVEGAKGVAQFGEALWEAYVHSIELEAQAQYQQDMKVIEHWNDVFSSPNRMIDFAAMTFGNAALYSSYVALVSAATVSTGGVILLVVTFGFAVWSTLQYYDVIPEMTWEDLIK